MSGKEIFLQKKQLKTYCVMGVAPAKKYLGMSDTCAKASQNFATSLGELLHPKC